MPNILGVKANLSNMPPIGKIIFREFMKFLLEQFPLLIGIYNNPGDNEVRFMNRIRNARFIKVNDAHNPVPVR